MTGIMETSLYAVVILGAICLFRALFQKSISARMQYVVWMILIVRLLIPVTWESGLHLDALFPTQATAPRMQSPKTVQAPAPERMMFEQPSVVQQERVQWPRVQVADALGAQSAATPNNVERNNVDWESFVALIWGSGLAASVGWMLYIKRRWNRSIRMCTVEADVRTEALFAHCKERLGVTQSLQIRVVACEMSPALAFIDRRACVLIPTSLIEDHEALFYAMTHELMHYRRRDHLMCLLLNALKCMYWFHPLLRYAFVQIQADMETACDAEVIRELGMEKRTSYLMTLLRLFSNHRQPAPAMAQYRTKRIAKRRIEGAFMHTVSKRFAKCAAVFMATMLFICCFTTACQPTPDAPPVIGKQDGAKLDAAISATAAPGSAELYEHLGAPKHWEEQSTSEDEMVHFRADAQVRLPSTKQLPVAKAKLRAFTQQDIDLVGEVILGNDVTYYEVVDWTKEQLEAKLLQIKQYLAQGEEKQPMNELIYTESDLEFYQSLYEQAPYQKDLRPATLELQTLERDGYTYQGVWVRTELDGQAYAFQAGYGTQDQLRRICVTTTKSSKTAHFDGVYDMQTPYGVRLTREQAAKQASAIASRIDPDLTLCYVGVSAAYHAETDRNWGWKCVFMREINGCPTAYEATDVGTSMDTQVKRPVRYEKIEIVLDDQGVTSFLWENPMTVTQIANENVELLPFDEICGIAKQQLRMRLDYDVQRDPGCTVNIHQVSLGLMRVAIADSEEEYYYLPVWHFFDSIEHTEAYKDKWYKDGYDEGRSRAEEFYPNGMVTTTVSGQTDAIAHVTINALDGSVIDRDLGY